ncbi:hydroxypyruvate isomerase family protein [Silvibacterium dinghuense]|uniref:Hydroxypyruvate isomerase n=1 Tax=Silvibacterium dinghuense TaxID=1560006 RepID=A0A4Q1SIU6_9BACT|nr:TIM barrel protein [Silvibacterium dinghuense]RXS97541.1 hydroxypyruvate isomerase [Silvibacterium dinghuense]GGG99864.1 hydroxypyruvate isomerase [Silvibacterium dinghuense]
MLSRRLFLEAGVLSGIGALTASGEVSSGVAPPVSSGRIRQSVCRWCYPHLSVDELSTMAVRLGLQGVDLLEVEEYEIPRRYGLICTMGYAGGGTISDALNHPENHAAIETALRKNIPLAARAGVPNVITFSGNRRGMSDEQGAANTVLGLNRVKSIAEDHGVTICLELLNSKVNHPDYMADHTAWGVRVVEEVASPRVKLLYDIYHMQIMEGDLIDTIRGSIGAIGHFHTGGVPGRHELGSGQEIQYEAVMRAIAATDFSGYVAHEFLPTIDTEAALRQAMAVCNV